MAIIIGEIIHELVKKSGLKAKFVAEYINVSESTLFGIYKRESVDIDKLILFSKLFNKNLFLHYLNEEPLKSMFSKESLEYQNKIIDLESELEVKTAKLNDLSEIIEAQKKVIALHEEKVKPRK
ncbi:hypothetical protein [Pedobacter helvus]|uniref:HTH cro/C1-type domain-containing protein n=1 Tax=Pedobacter helvus TaxID=2563444 RepID=A0ABW9JP78_9SPHI|nr:hypothetical protein [Pedobacter ureilyticus]